MRPQCFVIMPIGNSETEFLWDKVYKRVLHECGFDPDRIDQSEDGSDLPPQIWEKLTNANLIIADLSMERQNCYLELGYAMGKHTNHNSIILCCRRDHDPFSPGYRQGGPRVHFDLITRNIIWWEPYDCDAFVEQLKIKILRRWKQIEKLKQKPQSELSQKWRDSKISRVADAGEARNIEQRLKRAREESFR